MQSGLQSQQMIFLQNFNPVTISAHLKEYSKTGNWFGRKDFWYETPGTSGTKIPGPGRKSNHGSG